MKLRVGDTVLVTAGKDRGKQGQVVRTVQKKNAVVVEGMNMYTRHVKPQGGQPGDTVRRERPLPVSKVAIVNEKGQRDRIGYTVTKEGKKERIYKKTGTVIAAQKKPAKAKKK